VLEDKIVQCAVVAVLKVIYELDFLGFSYGFRPNRNQHQALDALYVGIMTKKVSWVLDADIRVFFDTLGHMRYYAIPMNNRAMSAFRQSVQWLWWKTLKRRSQKHNLSWRRMKYLSNKWLPPVRVYHPYPLVRLD